MGVSKGPESIFESPVPIRPAVLSPTLQGKNKKAWPKRFEGVYGGFKGPRVHI